MKEKEEEIKRATVVLDPDMYEYVIGIKKKKRFRSTSDALRFIVIRDMERAQKEEKPLFKG